MKNVLIVGSRHSGGKNDPLVLSQSISSDETSARVVYWEDLVFHIETGNVAIDSQASAVFDPAPDLVIAVGWYKNGEKSIYRDVAYSLALFLRRHNIEFWNSEMADQRSTTKLSCMMRLALKGVPVPSTTFSLGSETIIREYETPFIAKAAAASRGRSNYLIERDEDRVLLHQNPAFYLFQPYLKNDHDLRVICFDGKPSLVLKRMRSAGAQTHMNNTSQGGEGAWVELKDISPDILTLSEKICIIMGRQMAGIDFIPDATTAVGYRCLEVNAIPQLTSGFDTNKKLMTFAQAVANHRRKQGE